MSKTKLVVSQQVEYSLNKLVLGVTHRPPEQRSLDVLDLVDLKD